MTNLHITQTSPDCLRYELRTNGKRIWSNRVALTQAGQQGAWERMTAWMVEHQVTMGQVMKAAA